MAGLQPGRIFKQLLWDDPETRDLSQVAERIGNRVRERVMVGIMLRSENMLAWSIKTTLLLLVMHR